MISQSRHSQESPVIATSSSSCQYCKGPRTHGSCCKKHYFANVANQAWQRSKGRSGSARKPCDIRYKDWLEVSTIYPSDGLCAVCKREMVKGGGVHQNNTASLDCIRPLDGYVFGNMWFICWECNKHKGEMSVEEHIEFGHLLERATKSRMTDS